MNIVNDIVSFSASDILLFSPGMRAAIVAEIGTSSNRDDVEVPVRTPQEELSAWINLRLAQVLERYAARTAPSLDALQTAFARASDASRAAAKVHLDNAKAVLGVVVVDPVVTR